MYSTYFNEYICTYIYICICTHAHTHTRAHTHTHTCSLAQNGCWQTKACSNPYLLRALHLWQMLACFHACFHVCFRFDQVLLSRVCCSRVYCSVHCSASCSVRCGMYCSMYCNVCCSVCCSACCSVCDSAVHICMCASISIQINRLFLRENCLFLIAIIA